MPDRNFIKSLFEKPFFELVNSAYLTTKENFKNDDIELCELLSIKTGACPEDCSYCPQSGHYKTEVQKEKLWSIGAVMQRARAAKERGAKRFCMGAAWKTPPAKEFPQVLEIIKAVKGLGMETCVTLGELTKEQAAQLKTAELDFYNHNIDTSPEYYNKIISTHTQQDRIDTLQNVSEAGLNVCCGGIMGMGESQEDRIGFLLTLLSLPQPLQSIPINRLIATKGTPLAETKPMDNFEFIRVIATARLLFPTSRIRLSAGREDMSSEMQALCFMAGANSIFCGDVLLTAKNPTISRDMQLLHTLGLRTEKIADTAIAC
jgi:biotin synthase